MAILGYLFLAALSGFALGVATGTVTPWRRVVHVSQKTRIHPIRQNFDTRR